MSSTGWEQQGWELLGGAAERVTRVVSGTKATHCANKGNTCRIARSLICRQLLPLGTFTPRTSRQYDNAPLVQSRSLPLCAAITNFASLLATQHPLSGLRGVVNSSTLLFSPSSQTSCATCTTTSVQGCELAEEHAWHTTHVLHHMQTTCLHVAHCIPVRKVMKSSLPVCESGVPSSATTMTTSAPCRFVPFPGGAAKVSDVPGPPKKGNMSLSSPTASLRWGH